MRCHRIDCIKHNQQKSHITQCYLSSSGSPESAATVCNIPLNSSARTRPKEKIWWSEFDGQRLIWCWIWYESDGFKKTICSSNNLSSSKMHEQIKNTKMDRSVTLILTSDFSSYFPVLLYWGHMYAGVPNLINVILTLMLMDMVRIEWCAVE